MNDKYLKSNLILLGEGLSRLVFALNDYLVLKVAKSYDGLMQNFIEHHVYKNCPNSFKKYLCPVVFYNKKYLIMLRASHFSNFYNEPIIDISALRNENNAKSHIFALADIFDLFKNDLMKMSSWGIINNIYYLVDYGCNNPSSDSFYNNLMKCYY